MTQNTSNIWANMQPLLEASLSRGHYNVWITPLNAMYFATPSPLLKLFAPTSFVASKIKESYMATIKVAAQNVAGYSVDVQIIEGLPEEGALLAKAGDHSGTPAGHADGCTGGYTNSEETVSTSGLTGLAGLAAGQNNNIVSENSSAAAEGKAHFLSAGRPHYAYSSTCKKQEQMGLPLNNAPALLPLQPYSFENFVVGPSNQLAHAASRSLAESIIKNVQSLFLNSGPGLGKTHLVQAIASELKRQGRVKCRVACLTAEEFTSRFIASIKAKDTESFKARYRELDILLLEDIQFLQGKEKSQEEVLSTIKAIRERGGRVVFSSSFAPEDLSELDTQLTSRFCSGFLTSIMPPCFKTRCDILSSKATFYNTPLPHDVTELLAENVTSDIRRIESALQNLILQAQLLNTEINLELARMVLRQFAQEAIAPSLKNIVSSVCSTFDLEEEELSSKTRRSNFVTARNTIFFLARRHTNLTLAEIGRHLNRTHASVLKGISSIEREIKRQTPLGNQLQSTIKVIEKQF